jgi:hypothetical protein
MRKIFLAVLIAIVFIGCKKSNDRETFHAEGMLDGFDACGNVLLTIDGDTTRYKIASLPDMPDFHLVDFIIPRRISFDYYVSPLQGCGTARPLIVADFTLH